VAITASIALSSATAKNEQTVAVTLTVSNSGGAIVNVNSVAPTCVPSGLTSQSVAVALGVPQVAGAFPSAVPASGTLTYTWGVTPHAPTNIQGLAEGASYVYTLGATVLTNDGSITAASTSDLTVTPIATN
jgi:hypothetical protein